MRKFNSAKWMLGLAFFTVVSVGAMSPRECQADPPRNRGFGNNIVLRRNTNFVSPYNRNIQMYRYNGYSNGVYYNNGGFYGNGAYNGGAPYNGGAAYNGGAPYNGGMPYNGGAAYNGGMPYNGGGVYNGGSAYGPRGFYGAFGY